MKYKDIVSGKWNNASESFKIACCDCGLVHGFNFRAIKNGNEVEIQFKAHRDERATGQVRRHKRPKEKT